MAYLVIWLVMDERNLNALLPLEIPIRPGWRNEEMVGVVKGWAWAGALAAVLVMLAAGVARAQNQQGGSPNFGAGDDTQEITVDSHTESSVDNSQADDHSISAERVHIGDSVTSGQTDHHAETAPNAYSFSTPVASPCGDSTGMSVQTGIAGGGLATVSEACRAYRVSVLEQMEEVSVWKKRAITFAYWAGYPTRLVLSVLSGGALN